MTAYDYIIAGAGSSSCVLANCLAKAGKSILLLEAGPPDNTPFIRRPLSGAEADILAQ